MAKITIEDINAAIVGETYTLLPDERTTVCQLTLFKEDGFSVIGTSAVVDKTGFDQEVGNRFAREKAIEQIWPLLGFKLFLEKYNNLVVR